MSIFMVIGLITAYFKYRNLKQAKDLESEKELPEPVVPYGPKPLPEGASRLERIAHWLGIVEV